MAELSGSGWLGKLCSIRDDHVVADLGNNFFLLHIDRHIVHDLRGPAAMLDVQQRGLRIRNPELAFATADHTISSAKGRLGATETGIRLLDGLPAGARAAGVRMFDIGEPGQGIVHVIGPRNLAGTTALDGLSIDLLELGFPAIRNWVPAL